MNYTGAVLSADERRALLTLARQAVAAAARGDGPPGLPDPAPALRERGAAFVTLRALGELRGCIGHVEAVKPLWESVREMAGAAATRDSRFSPVRPDEISRLDVEISVLSPLRPVRPEEVAVGTHGVCVRSGGLSGLLLPQVAVEWNWNRDEFIRRAFEKAGIPAGDPAAELLAFTAELLSGGPD